MGKTRDVVERFYDRSGANDLDGAFGNGRQPGQVWELKRRSGART